jgi:hypothetical protein
MAKPTTAESIGGIFLIIIGIAFTVAGIIISVFPTTMIIQVLSIFFSSIPSIILLFGIANILFGLFLIWAGRIVRNEPFLPKFLKK